MYRQALTEDGIKLWPRFKGLGQYYLAGGTAVALQLGHRLSVDFDFSIFHF